MDPVLDALRGAYTDAVDGGAAAATVTELMASYAAAATGVPAARRGGPEQPSVTARAARKLKGMLRR